jgi:hypothetical protein
MPELHDRLDELDRFRDMDERQVEPLYAARAAAIRSARTAGATVSEIARRLNVGRKVIYDALESQ